MAPRFATYYLLRVFRFASYGLGRDDGYVHHELPVFRVFYAGGSFLSDPIYNQDVRTCPAYTVSTRSSSRFLQKTL